MHETGLDGVQSSLISLKMQHPSRQGLLEKN
jgi:hypothetical protein